MRNMKKLGKGALILDITEVLPDKPYFRGE